MMVERPVAPKMPVTPALHHPPETSEAGTPTHLQFQPENRFGRRQASHDLARLRAEIERVEALVDFLSRPVHAHGGADPDPDIVTAYNLAVESALNAIRRVSQTVLALIRAKDAPRIDRRKVAFGGPIRGRSDLPVFNSTTTADPFGTRSLHTPPERRVEALQPAKRFDRPTKPESVDRVAGGGLEAGNLSEPISIEGVHPVLADGLADDRRQGDQTIVGVGPRNEFDRQRGSTRLDQLIGAELGAFEASDHLDLGKGGS